MYKCEARSLLSQARNTKSIKRIISSSVCRSQFSLSMLLRRKAGSLALLNKTHFYRWNGTLTRRQLVVLVDEVTYLFRSWLNSLRTMALINTCTMYYLHLYRMFRRFHDKWFRGYVFAPETSLTLVRLLSSTKTNSRLHLESWHEMSIFFFQFRLSIQDMRTQVIYGFFPFHFTCFSFSL